MTKTLYPGRDFPAVSDLTARGRRVFRDRPMIPPELATRRRIIMDQLARQTAPDPEETQIPAEARRAPVPAPLGPRPGVDELKLDRSRDDLLTAFGKQTLADRYLARRRGSAGHVSRVWPALMPTTATMPSVCTMRCPSCGSCRPRRFCPTAEPRAACRFPAF